MAVFWGLVLFAATSAVKVPQGLGVCQPSSAIRTILPEPRVGESIRYWVDVNGVSVGKVDFKTERVGVYESEKVVEYRTLFNIDSLVATLLPMQGRAASLASVGGFFPVRAMNTYSIQEQSLKETILFSKQAKHVDVSFERAGRVLDDHRTGAFGFVDALTAFYQLRALPLKSKGCVCVYAHHRVYTVWLGYEGVEEFKTPVGYKAAERYRIQWGSDKGKKVFEGKVWMAVSEDRLPLQAISEEPYEMKAYVKSYVKGQK